MKETFSKEDLTATSKEYSFESRVYAEIEKVKQELLEIQREHGNPGHMTMDEWLNQIEFFTDEAGVAIMKVGPKLRDEMERAQFKPESRTKYLLRKYEDLVYAREHGKFPDEVPRHEIA